MVEYISTNSILLIVQHEGDSVRCQKCCQPFLMSYLSCFFIEHEILPSELNCPCSPFLFIRNVYSPTRSKKTGFPLDLQLFTVFPYHLVISLKLLPLLGLKILVAGADPHFFRQPAGHGMGGPVLSDCLYVSGQGAQPLQWSALPLSEQHPLIPHSLPFHAQTLLP